MRDKRMTVADLLALKGERQLSMLRVETLEEAAAAEHIAEGFVTGGVAESGLVKITAHGGLLYAILSPR